MKTLKNRTKCQAIILASLLPAPGIKADDWKSAASGSWSTDANWGDASAPTTTDPVNIMVSGVNYTVTMDVSPTILSLLLDSTNATLTGTGRAFSVSGTSTINAGALNLTSSTWTSAGISVGTAATITLTETDVSGTGIFTNSGTVRMSGTTSANPVELGAGVTLDNQGVFETRGPYVQFNGAVTNRNGATLRLLSLPTSSPFNVAYLTLANGMTNHGNITLTSSGAVSFTPDVHLVSTAGTVVNEAGGVIDVLAGVGGGRSILAQLDNRGTLNVAQTVEITKSGAAQFNSGTINVTAGNLSVASFASFANSNVISVTGTSSSLSFTGATQASSTWSNTDSGTVTTSNAGLSLSALNTITNAGTINAMAGNLTLSAYNTFDNSGTVNVGTGHSFTATNGTINNAAGATLQGGGAISLNTLTFNIDTAYSNGASNLTVNESDFGGTGTFTSTATTTMTGANPGNPAALGSGVTLVNQGLFETRGRAVQFNGAATNENGATLRLVGFADNSSLATGFLTLANGMTNHGNITLTSSGTFFFNPDVRLISTAGTIVNETDGVINVVPGAGGARTITAELDNRGALNVSQTLGINKPGAAHLNSGTINVSAGNLNYAGFASFANSNLISVTGTSSGITFTGSAQALSTWSNTGSVGVGGLSLSTLNSITNSGTITANNGNITLGGYNTFGNTGTVSVGSGHSFTATGGTGTVGTINNAPGAAIQGAGGATFNSLTLNNAPGATLAMGGSTVFSSSTFNFDTAYTNGASNLTISESDFGGTGTFTSTATTTMTGANPGNPAALGSGVTLVNQGLFETRGQYVQFNGAATNENGATLRLMGVADNSSLAGAFLTLANGMTNHGNITLTSSGTFFFNPDVRLISTAGTIVNETDGVINVLPGVGGARTITAQLDNRGTLNVAQTVDITRSGAAQLNSGTINVSAGNLSVASFASFANSNLINGTGTASALTFTGAAQVSSTWSNSTSGTVVVPGGGLTLSTLNTITNLGAVNSANGNLTLSAYNTFNNSGSVAIGTGHSFTATNGTINNAAGATLQGGGAIALNTLTFNIDTAYTSGTSNLTINESDFGGSGTFTSTDTTIMTGVNSGNPATLGSGVTLDNLGVFETRGQNVQFNGPVTNQNGATLRLHSLPTSASLAPAFLTLANGMSNHGNVTLTTSGSLAFTPDVRLISTAGTIVNETDGVIDVLPGSAGGARTLNAQLDNRGTLNVATTATIAKTGAAHLNSGTVNLTSGGLTTTLSGSFANQSGGRIRMDGANFTLTGSGSFTNEAGGVIEGRNTFSVATGVTFWNAGTVAPGNSTGTLNFSGVYNQSPTGKLSIEIGGTTPGTGYDRLVITGTANLDGFLEVSLINSFIPSPSDTFTILTATARTGTFDNAVGTLTFAGGTFDVTYNSTSTILTNFVPEPTSTILLLTGIGACLGRRRARPGPGTFIHHVSRS